MWLLAHPHLQMLALRQPPPRYQSPGGQAVGAPSALGRGRARSPSPRSPRTPGQTGGGGAPARRSRSLCRASAVGLSTPATLLQDPVSSPNPSTRLPSHSTGLPNGVERARLRAIWRTLANTLAWRAALPALARLLAAVAARSLQAAAADYSPIGRQLMLARPAGSSGCSAVADADARSGLLWMHRLPVYRARLRETLSAALVGGCGAETASTGEYFNTIRPGPCPSYEADALCNGSGGAGGASLRSAQGVFGTALGWALASVGSGLGLGLRAWHAVVPAAASALEGDPAASLGLPLPETAAEALPHVRVPKPHWSPTLVTAAAGEASQASVGLRPQLRFSVAARAGRVSYPGSMTLASFGLPRLGSLPDVRAVLGVR